MDSSTESFPPSKTSNSNSIGYAKYTGCGNEFVILDNRSGRWDHPNAPAITQSLGGDGVIFLENSEKGHIRMRIFNADGSEAEMCGNGLRCLVRFALDLGMPDRPLLVETKERLLAASRSGDLFKVAMGDPQDISWNQKIKEQDASWIVDVLNTGVPHAVHYVDNLSTAPVGTLGPLLRRHSAFRPRGVNVNFVQITKRGHIAIRTYERGVERETLACGTGATAAALSYAFRYAIQSPVTVLVASGETLHVHFHFIGKDFQKIHLVGPAQKVSEGRLPSLWLREVAPA